MCSNFQSQGPKVTLQSPMLTSPSSLPCSSSHSTTEPGSAFHSHLPDLTLPTTLPPAQTRASSLIGGSPARTPSYTVLSFCWEPMLSHICHPPSSSLISEPLAPPARPCFPPLQSLLALPSHTPGFLFYSTLF